jgi:hypothetical protein
MGTPKTLSLEERNALNTRKALESKTCSKCGFNGNKEKYFHKSVIRGISQYGNCKKCQQELTRAWRYNISIEDMNTMLDKATHCEICENEFITNRKVIDHCHKDKHIRGILCDPCNTTLGYLEKKDFMLERMTNYLKTKNKQI